MCVLETGVCRTARWAIVDTLYFDSSRHRFARGDIEIEGPRIVQVLPPRTSQCAWALAGEATVCLPGLIDSDAGTGHEDWNRYSRELVAHGVTTAGLFCGSLAECAEYCGPDGVRRLLYVELPERSGSGDDAAASERALESFGWVVKSISSAYCEVFPAVVPGEIWSATTLVAAAHIAGQMGRRLCVRLSSTTGDAKRYKEARCFTEVGLLSYLSLLSQVTIFNLSQLNRRDAAMVNESSANLVCEPGAVSALLLEERFARLSLKGRALAFSISRHAVERTDLYTSLMALSTELTHQSDDAAATCNLVVDALTCSAAQALGIANIGAIAADMKADLCLFDRPYGFAENGDSRDFIRLLAHSKPREVLINGAPMVFDSASVREQEQA